MVDKLKIAFCILFILITLYSPARAQLSYSTEIGFLYNTILMDGGYGALCYYNNHANGLHLGFNIHNQHNTTISLQFTFTDFIYYRNPDSFKDFFNNKNTYFYDVALKFRTNFLRGNFRPFFSIGPGMHFMHWGDLYNPVYDQSYIAVDDYAPEWDQFSQFYFNIGAGIEFRLFNNFDLVLEKSWTFSKSFYFSPLITALKYNF